MDFINKIFRGDRVIWMIFMFLCLISIVEVYSASSTLTYRSDYWVPIGRHTMFMLVGTAVVLITHSIKPRFLSVLALMLPIALVLLLATKFMGTSINGADRWISIGPISFQPSELAKLSLIAFTAFVLSKYKENNVKDYRFPLIIIATVFTCGIILIDNFSTAVLLFSIVCIMMFIGQIPWKRMFQMAAVLVIVLAMFISFLFLVPTETLKKVFPRGATWIERVKDFNHDKKDMSDPAIAFNDDNYQVSHSKIAITRGGVLGKLPGNSLERDFLPQAYSDFIFAIIIEEMGLIGGIGVLMLYVILFIRAGIIANRCERMFPKYLVIGCALIIVSQALANMAVAVNLIPVTGQPLPLISRGGTSTIITCVYVGIILSVSRFENPKGVQREVAIAIESEEERQEANEVAFEEENINAGEF